MIYVFTHDSIGLGEDGPTHQPVEQLLGLRSIPNMVVIRPADANETAAAWKVAVERRDTPVALVLTRQKLPILDPEAYPQIREGVARGGYILAQAAGEQPSLILVATGSEVHPALGARQKLLAKGIRARVVSFPSWNLFQEQSEEYQSSVFPSEIPILAVEAGGRWDGSPTSAPNRGDCVDRFGASAPGDTVMNEYGFNVDNICKRVDEMLKHKEIVT